MLADHAKLLQFEVEKATAEVVNRERELVLRLSKAAEFRDPETGAHIYRMAFYSKLIAQSLGLPEAYQRDILEAAPMHNVGKLATPDYILLKPGKLAADEMSIMRRHAEIGAQILAGSSSALLRLAEEIAGAHHEKFDGSGYPKGLKGEEIPLAGRIVAVADCIRCIDLGTPLQKALADRAGAPILAGKYRIAFLPALRECILELLGRSVEDRIEFPGLTGLSHCACMTDHCIA